MSETNGAVIRMDGITKVYRSGVIELEALRGIDLTIQNGEMVAIIGTSGSGKSTLMNLMGCLDLPSRGRYEFDGHDVARLSAAEVAMLRNRSIGFIFQSFHLLPYATARENVEMPLLFAGMPAGRRRGVHGRGLRGAITGHVADVHRLSLPETCPCAARSGVLREAQHRCSG